MNILELYKECIMLKNQTYLRFKLDYCIDDIFNSERIHVSSLNFYQQNINQPFKSTRLSSVDIYYIFLNSGEIFATSEEVVQKYNEIEL